MGGVFFSPCIIFGIGNHSSRRPVCPGFIVLKPQTRWFLFAHRPAWEWFILGSCVLACLLPSASRCRGAVITTPNREISGQGCLPASVSRDDVVTYGRNGATNINVQAELRRLKGRCRQGKLVDARGREIRFFRHECWGNPPADYREILTREQTELARLKKKYTVIQISCGPTTLSSNAGDTDRPPIGRATIT